MPARLVLMIVVVTAASPPTTGSLWGKMWTQVNTYKPSLSPEGM